MFSFRELVTVMTTTLMQIVRRYFCNLLIVFGKLPSNFQTHSNSTTIFLWPSWITFTHAGLALSCLTVKEKEFKTVRTLLNLYMFVLQLAAFLGVKESTVSLWSYTNTQLDLYRNPLYWANVHQQLVLIPIASIRHIKLWKSYYCRWNPSMRTQVLNL